MACDDGAGWRRRGGVLWRASAHRPFPCPPTNSRVYRRTRTAPPQEGKNALHHAASEGHRDAVEWLVKKGFEVDAKTKKGAAWRIPRQGLGSPLNNLRRLFAPPPAAAANAHSRLLPTPSHPHPPQPPAQA